MMPYNQEQDSGSSALDLMTYGINGLSFGTDAGLQNFLMNRQVELTRNMVDAVLESPDDIADALRPHFEGLSNEVIKIREADSEHHAESLEHAAMMTNDIVMAVQLGVSRLIESQAREGEIMRQAIADILNKAVMALSYTINQATRRIIKSNFTSPRQALLRLLNRDDTALTVENITFVQENPSNAEALFSTADLALIHLFTEPGGADIFVRNTIKNDPDTLLLFLEVETINPHWKEAKKTAFERILELALEKDRSDKTGNDWQMASVDHLLLLLANAGKYEEVVNETHNSIPHPSEGDQTTEENYYRTRVYQTLRDIAGDFERFNSKEQTQAQLILHAANQLSEEEKTRIELGIERAQKAHSK